jgi:anaerobic magnesium-protoporphyrin IX monomethyl ester cyclase
MELRGKANWLDSDDLAMMFRGAYATDFYRDIRDLLHQEVNARGRWHAGGRQDVDREFAGPWAALERREGENRSSGGASAKRVAAGT